MAHFGSVLLTSFPDSFCDEVDARWFHVGPLSLQLQILHSVNDLVGLVHMVEGWHRLRLSWTFGLRTRVTGRVDLVDLRSQPPQLLLHDQLQSVSIHIG